MRARWVLLLAGLIAASALWLAGGEPIRDPLAAPEASGGPRTGPGLRGASERAKRSQGAAQDAKRQEAPDPVYLEHRAHPWNPRMARVIGRIAGPDGEGVAQASISATVSDSVNASEESTYTDGRFVIDLAGPHDHRLVITAEGFAPRVLATRHYESGAITDLGIIRLVLGLTIQGTVVDEWGRPHEGVVVHLEADADPIPAWWLSVYKTGGAFEPDSGTDDAGLFAFDQLPPGPYRLRFDSSRAYDLAVLDRVPAGGVPVRVVVPRPPPEVETPQPTWTATLSLRTFDHAPVPDFELDFFGSFQGVGWEVDGTLAEIFVRGAGPLGVLVRPTEGPYRPTYVSGLLPSEPERTVVLTKGLVLQGRVTGVPPERLAGETLACTGWLDAHGRLGPDRPPKGSQRGWHRWTVTLDRRGAFLMRGLPPGLATLELETTAFTLRTTQTSLSAGTPPIELPCLGHAPVDLVFKAPSGETLGWLAWEVVALVDGGWRVVAADTNASDEEQVQARIHRLREGLEHRVRARVYEPASAGLVEVAIPPKAKTVTVQLPPRGVVRGRVRDATGAPIAYADVELSALDALPRQRPRQPDDLRAEVDDLPITRADSEGRFELTVAPTGAWRLLARSSGWTMGTPPIVRAGQEDVHLVMSPSRRITGQLRAAALVRVREGFVKYRIEAWASERGPVFCGRVVPSGFFEICGLPKGIYTLVAIRDFPLGTSPEDFHGTARVDGVAAGSRSVQLPLKQGLTTTLDLRNEAGHPLRHARVFLRGAFYERHLRPSRHGLDYDETGPFRVWGVPPGSYHFDIEVPGKGSQRINVKAGTTTRYVVR